MKREYLYSKVSLILAFFTMSRRLRKDDAKKLSNIFVPISSYSTYGVELKLDLQLIFRLNIIQRKM